MMHLPWRWNAVKKKSVPLIHPFDDEKVIAGQGTTAVEILNDCEDGIDYVFAAMRWWRVNGRSIELFQIGFPKIRNALELSRKVLLRWNTPSRKEKLSELENIDTFVDGAAVEVRGTADISAL